MQTKIIQTNKINLAKLDVLEKSNKFVLVSKYLIKAKLVTFPKMLFGNKK